MCMELGSHKDKSLSFPRLELPLSWEDKRGAPGAVEARSKTSRTLCFPTMPGWSPIEMASLPGPGSPWMGRH